MRVLAEIIHTVFGVYGLGLIVFVILSWVSHPQTNKARAWLGRFYVPFLNAIGKKVSPIEINPKLRVDLNPVILLIMLSVLRGFVIYLLIPRF